MTCFCHAESRIYDFKSPQVWVGCQRSISLWDMYMSRAVVADVISLSTFYFPFSNKFSDITNWNEHCIFDEQKSIVAQSSLHSNAYALSLICASCFHFVFKSQQKLVIKLSMDFKKSKRDKLARRIHTTKAATKLNQNEIEANQYEPSHPMRTIMEYTALGNFKQIMHFDGINIVRSVIKPHKILIQSASYTKMGVQTIVKLS